MHISEHGEPIEVKRERLMPMLQESFEQNTPLRVTRHTEHGAETIDGLICWRMNDDGPEFCTLDVDGEPGPSATMLWSEIIDIEK